ncbi:receptor-like protein EIX2 isoform X3 [Ziziphus jujuba]|uniref:Receptor-like protein EIX2 isoform X3 n=1 Tax=Ziziphus jujuba TaxID=326968 RepID=A0ABM4A002_ZIZJJ|nr:receptor-like protein EIX2 isoform X3 [Ziziphus jujuba]
MMKTASMFQLMLLILFFTRREFVRFGDAQLAECLESDRVALVAFKNGLNDPENRLSSWKGSNCCQWRGISCESSTGAVIAVDLHNPYPQGFDSSSRYGFWNLSGEIKPSMMKLKSLRYLDLSFNTFNDNPIPEFFGSLKNLQYLNLSNAEFSGAIPPNLGNLSSLQYLDLKYSPSLYVENLEWLKGLVSLKHLLMREVDLSMVGSNWVRTINKLPSLTELDLSSCLLSGSIPPLSPFNLTSLAVVDLSFNGFNSKIPDWLLNISSLISLDISYSGLFGRIPLGFSDMPDLKFLNLAGNNNLTASCSQLLKGRWEKIRVLDLASNKLHGKLPASIGNMTFLTHLDLFVNNIEGAIPSSIGNLCNLIFFRISGNNLTGTLPEFIEGAENCHSRRPLPSLQYLDLSVNHLAGKLPEWIGQLKNIVQLGLDYNSLNGPIPASLGLLQNLTDLGLSGNDLNGTLPESLGQLSQLSTFDVSSNHLTDVDLSSNLFEGPIPLPIVEVELLDMSNNRLSGPIPSNIGDSLPNLIFLSLYGNLIIGEIPASIGNMQSLQALDLSNNYLRGSVPSSIANCSLLKVLDLRKNNLSGNIPDFLGELRMLQTLHLSDNNFSGELPSSFRNFSSLEMLDLGNNRLKGKIPPWIGEGFKKLRILSLRSNAFYGELPSVLSNLSSIQVLDLAENLLNGSIPASFGDFKSMSQIQHINHYLFYGMYRGSYYEENLVVNMKGQPQTYTKILSLVISLDLSGNNLSGDLPREITKLLGLVVLNLSGNHITGHIPESISELKQLLSLDLSSNRLSGPVPQSLGTLSFLGYLNLSYNDLSGRIPYTDHMTTFDAASFTGNLGLCGGPLAVKCPGDEDDEEPGKGWTTPKDTGNGDSFIDKWFYLSIGLGFAAGILVPYLIMAMRKSWCVAYFDAVNEVTDRILYQWLKYRTAKQRTRGH